VKSADMSFRAYVSESAFSTVSVGVVDDGILGALGKLGFTLVSNTTPTILSINVPSDEQMAKLFAELRDEGVCFSVGRDWCPSEVFEYLRGLGQVSGVYSLITWSGPGKFRIVENC
jgi:hypothetical protein